MEGEIICSSDDKRYGRGVAILIRENTNVVCKVVYNDDVGKVLAVEMIHDDNKVIVINVHAPNEEKGKREFFLKI